MMSHYFRHYLRHYSVALNNRPYYQPKLEYWLKVKLDITNTGSTDRQGCEGLNFKVKVKRQKLKDKRKR